MKFKRQFLWLILIILLYSALAVTSVSAHALLLRSNPAANAVLEQPPVQVEIFFSEALEANLSSIKVFDSNNLAVDAGDVRVDPVNSTRMTVSLHRLGDGVYTVTWKAVSAIDGHQTVGTFPFAVGNSNANAVNAIPPSSSFRLPFSALISKFLMLAALALLVGQRLFTALIWNPAFKQEQDGIPSQAGKPAVWARLYRVGLVAILVSIGLGILGQAGQATGNELAFPWSLEVGSLLTGTRLGVIWLARLVLAMLAVWLAGRKETTLRDWTAFTVNLALLFMVTLTSHAATEARPILSILADWIHLIGMTFWFGGLVYLLTGIRQLQQVDGKLRTQLTALLANRFSVNAMVFVAFIGLTGLYSAYLRVGSWYSVMTSLYGHVLLIKQAFVAGLLIIAAVNFLVISPRLEFDRLTGVADSWFIARFGKILIVELTLAGLLLATVTFLTYLPPAKVALTNPDLVDETIVDDLTMDISISPGYVGQNTFTLTVITSTGHPLHSAKEVLLRFTPNQPNIAPSELELIGQGDGTFMAKGTYLSIPGNWQVQAVVRRENRFDAFANFNFKLQNPGTTNQSSTTPRQTSMLILIGGMLCGLLTFSVNADPLYRFGAGLSLTILMMGLGIFLIVRPIPVNIERANPIPPNSESVEAGRAIYIVHCVPCHGESGKGDGPLGLVLNPRPADLRQHAIPGVHTDAQLFEWITNGFPGSSMPAWKSSLSDTDRWNLVNFVRTLAPK
jgi:copper transport protein